MKYLIRQFGICRVFLSCPLQTNNLLSNRQHEQQIWNMNCTAPQLFTVPLPDKVLEQYEIMHRIDDLQNYHQQYLRWNSTNLQVAVTNVILFLSCNLFKAGSTKFVSINICLVLFSTVMLLTRTFTFKACGTSSSVTATYFLLEPVN